MTLANTAPQQIYRKDYTPPTFHVRQVNLSVQIFADHASTHVTLDVERQTAGPLRLYGETLALETITLDNVPISIDAYEVDDEGLLIHTLPDSCTVRVSARLDPYNNTALEGLYASGGMLCTQCEPQGFRRICFYPDRPDVMSVFTTRIEAPVKMPHLLSNGNLVETGSMPGDRHFAVWHDPHPKPSYLFALVAGDLELVADKFVTASGREVTLHIYVEHGNAHLTKHAMESLKASMLWDEQVYGLEYDLDLFQIVAVSHFNMGAMENKGLNIFNSKCVLADEKTATDDDLGRVEAIVAHEYFHNWTGNRVTCRDWFQLTLKEGLTVFRDQCFTADRHDAGVKRAQDVSLLRAAQFPEDAGPTAHPIRPEAYAEINNFYTATVYEKGSEIIRMFHKRLGPDGFRKGMDLYFARHDGQAVTCDDFVAALADANATDLSDFMRWYEQAGTPELTIKRQKTSDGLKLVLSQTLPETAAKTPRNPVPIPVPIQLLGPDGVPIPFGLDAQDKDAAEQLLVLDGKERSFTLSSQNVDVEALQSAVPSWLRGFSAPVTLQDDLSVDERLHLAAYDSDLFNRWDALQNLLTKAILARLASAADTELEAKIADSYKMVLSDKSVNAEFQALMMRLPSQAVLEAAHIPADPPAIFTQKLALQAQLSTMLSSEITALYKDFRPLETADAGARALQNMLLSWGVSAEIDGFAHHALQQSESQNMTLSAGALQALNVTDTDVRSKALSQFEAKWHMQPLVMEKYFALQASAPFVATPSHVETLMQHPQFDANNPNKLRSTVGVFAASNPLQFHHESGAGYHFVAKQLADIDTRNPQIAARMAATLARFGAYDEKRQTQMREALQKLAASDISRDLSEVVSKALQA